MERDPIEVELVKTQNIAGTMRYESQEGTLKSRRGMPRWLIRKE